MFHNNRHAELELSELETDKLVCLKMPFRPTPSNLKETQFIVNLDCSSVHFKLEPQFWDVLFSTISLTCLLSLSSSVIQARLSTQHTPVRKSRKGETSLSLNLDYGFVSIYLWPLNQKICGKQSEIRLSG